MQAIHLIGCTIKQEKRNIPKLFQNRQRVQLKGSVFLSMTLLVAGVSISAGTKTGL